VHKNNETIVRKVKPKTLKIACALEMEGVKKVIRCSNSNSTGKNFDKGQISERKVCLKRTNRHFLQMETIVSKVKRKVEKNKTMFFANLNAHSLNGRIPLLSILNDLLSGRRKTVRVLGTEGVKKGNSFYSVSWEARLGVSGKLHES